MPRDLLKDDIVPQIESRYGIPRGLLGNLISAESAWNPKARSPVGAHGLAQFMPATAKEVGINPDNPIESVEGAAKYLKQNYDRFGNWEHALAAYNAGPGAVQKYGGVPPYKETQGYVSKIMSGLGNALVPKAEAAEDVLAAPRQTAQGRDLFAESGIEPPPRRSMVEHIGDLGAGMLSGFRGVGEGMVQGGKEVVDALGLGHPITGEDAAAYSQRIMQQRQAAGAGRGGAYTAGQVIGGAAPFLPIPVAGGAGAAASAGRVAAGAGLGGAIGGAQFVEPGESRLNNAVVGAAMGGGASGVLEGATALMPNNVIGRAVNYAQHRAMKKPYAKEGLDVAQRTGIDLTPAMVSGSRVGSIAENLARQSIHSSDRVLEVDQKIAEQAIKHTNKLMDQLATTSRSPTAVGVELRSSIDKAVRKLATDRKTTAATDYGQVRQLAGNRPVIQYNSTVDEINKIIGEFENVGGADAAKVTTQAKALLARLGKREPPSPILGPDGKPLGGGGPKGYTVDEAMKTRSYYSKAARGEGRIFDDVSPTLDRRIAARLRGAIEQDFEAAAGGAGDIAAALKAANTRYRNYSRAIEAVELSPLGKLMGKEFGDDAVAQVLGNTIPPERLARAVVKMTPSEAALTRKLLEKHAPDALQTARRHILEQALEAGETLSASAGANAPRLEPGNLLRALPNDDAMKAWFSASDLNEINRLVNALRRYADKSGYNFSGTAPWQEAATAFKSLWAGSVQGLSDLTGRALGIRAVADMMADPGSRDAMMKLALYGPKSQAAKRAVTVLAVRAAVQPDQSDR